MALKIVRVLFILACVFMGVLWAFYLVPAYHGPQAVGYDRLIPWCGLGAVVGGAVGIAIAFLLALVRQEVFDRVSPAITAVVLALVAGFVLGQWVLEMYYPGADAVVKTFLICTLVLLFGFVGVSIALSQAANWREVVQAVRRHGFGGPPPKIVDTSVIIDGRIVDICHTGFVEGALLVPRFVLRELHSIADSSDVLRRARGRRGLDILRVLQEPGSGVSIEVIEDDPSDVAEVDGKLVRVARKYGAKILTNDLNLNKVAQIEGVEVLNVNDLANALKPAVLPDEEMIVRLVKEGKEALQGVGYLDDGTMVVVDGGKEFVGKEVSVLVTSVLQTSAGRMIFGRLRSVVP